MISFSDYCISGRVGFTITREGSDTDITHILWDSFFLSLVVVGFTAHSFICNSVVMPGTRFPVLLGLWPCRFGATKHGQFQSGSVAFREKTRTCHEAVAEHVGGEARLVQQRQHALHQQQQRAAVRARRLQQRPLAREAPALVGVAPAHARVVRERGFAWDELDITILRCILYLI